MLLVALKAAWLQWWTSLPSHPCCPRVLAHMYPLGISLLRVVALGLPPLGFLDKSDEQEK